jgi:hypothetical protein
MSFKILDSQLLEKTELNKLHLVWLFYTDFDKVLKNETTDLLNQTWQNMKIDLKKWFNNYEICLDTIVENFKKIIITTDSRIALRYKPLTNIVSSKILELFFSQANIGRNKFVCSISWKLARAH